MTSRPIPSRLPPPVLVVVIVGIGLMAPACRGAPEARYWQDRKADPRPYPPVAVTLAWEEPVPVCPERLVLDASGAWTAIGPDGEERRVGPLDGSDAAAHSPPAASGGAAPMTWEGRTYEVEAGRGTVRMIREGKTRWTFRAAAAIVVPPQIHRGRLLVQSLDNYAYCLRADNGHEIWRRRLDGRLTRPAAFWNDRALLVGEGSESLVVIDMFDGSPAGGWTLPEGPPRRFVTGPHVRGDLAVAAHAAYGSRRCAVAALRLVEGTAAPEE